MLYAPTFCPRGKYPTLDPLIPQRGNQDAAKRRPQGSTSRAHSSYKPQEPTSTVPSKSREKIFPASNPSPSAAPSRAFKPHPANRGASLFAEANRSSPQAVGRPPATVTRQAPGRYSLESRGGGGGESSLEESFEGGGTGNAYGELGMEARHLAL